MRVFLAFSVLIISVGISQLLIKKYILKRAFLTDFNNFNKKMINQVSFEKKTLIKIIEESGVNDFIELLNAIIFQDRNFTRPSYIEDEDYNQVMEYCEILGRTDKDTQNNHLLYFDKILNDNLNKSIQIEKEKKSLYTKMGLMIGLILFIIVI